jgi:hypothetical protein
VFKTRTVRDWITRKRARACSEALGKFDRDGPYTDLKLSMIEDAVHFVPALGPLAAAALGSAEKEAT